MLKKLQNKQVYLITGAGLGAFLLGVGFSFPQAQKTLGKWFDLSQMEVNQSTQIDQSPSAVGMTIAQSLPERSSKLREIAEKGDSPDRERARYVLASDYIQTNQGKPALELLVGLEKNYPVLAPYILLKQAQAQDMLGEKGLASDLRQRVLRDYPKSPAAVKAMYLIGQPKLQERAIAEFPSHPLTWEIIRNRLRENSNQPKLQLILAKYATNEPGTVGFLDNLVQFQQSLLTPADWEVIGAAYWDNNEFIKASSAYKNSPQTAKNLYRTARGLQLDKKRESAIVIYKQQVKLFPKEKETGTALLRLAEMTSGKNAIAYLDQIIAQFPSQAPQALAQKAKLLTSLKDNQSANQAWKLLLSKYSSSDVATEYRWQTALTRAKNQDYVGAWEWAQPIPTQNPNSILAPRASFWVGKWASLLGKNEEARKSYEYVLANFPQSYYAWRSARILGWDVGDFNNLRLLNPQITLPQRPLPPAGTDTFKELYLMAQDRDAWYEWETGFKNNNQPTVKEQFTEGLMRLVKGDNLIGIAKISQLEDRETPQERAEYAVLSRQITYWQARYPLLYLEPIQKWASARQVNPLLVVALMRQESMFQPKIKSVAGAVGLMQVMPNTAKWIAPQISMDMKTINLENPNDNIMLGTWYLDHTHQQYNNNSMLAIASYNAGPGNVAKWLRTIPKKDPDEFVEEIPFGETRNYVRQVLGNYWNYLRLYNPEISALVSKYAKSGN
ncbi:MAG: transglycosylase SLT domain-containing protein [Cylindrospermopsis raciborskii]|uniref:lytic transglycosylase domain-containing protein n=1 Tax=Cylindrospermopsis raciborskii TaxID=77022 RepID=UPI003D100BE0